VPAAVANGVWVGESQVWDADRREFPVSHMVIAHRDKQGKVEYFSTLMRDISAAKATEQALQESEARLRTVADALPMREAFAVLFFVSLGMLLDPGTLLDDPQMLAATLAIVLIGKPLAALAVVALSGYPMTVALSVAVALAQIGEFSFVVATVASDYGVLTADATNVLIAAAIASITINPLLFRGIGWIARWLPRGGAALG